MISRHGLRVLTDPTDQHSREQEIGNHHHATETEAHHVPQPRFHQWESDSGINRFSPAEAEPLHQHPGDLGHIRVGIWIRGAPTHHHQKRVAQRNLGGCLIKAFLDPRAGGSHHQAIDAELPPVVDR